MRTLFIQKRAHIDLLVKEKFGFVYENCSYLKNQIFFTGNILQTVRTIKSNNYDYIVDLQNNYKSRILSGLSGIKTFRLNKINFRKFLTVLTKNRNWLPAKHIVDRMFDAVNPIGVVNDTSGLEYFIPEDFHKSPEHYGINPPYVALVSGGSYYTKQIPVEIIDKILKMYSLKNFVLLGDESDYERTKKLKASNLINLCGKIHFHESAWIIKNAECVITSDTGLMHVAAAFKKKIFSFWGNTIPEFGMYPYMPGKGSQCIEVRDLKCRPCSKLGYKKCPKGHFRCMLNQNLKNLIL